MDKVRNKIVKIAPKVRNQLALGVVQGLINEIETAPKVRRQWMITHLWCL